MYGSGMTRTNTRAKKAPTKKNLQKAVAKAKRPESPKEYEALPKICVYLTKEWPAQIKTKEWPILKDLQYVTPSGEYDVYLCVRTNCKGKPEENGLALVYGYTCRRGSPRPFEREMQAGVMLRLNQEGDYDMIAKQVLWLSGQLNLFEKTLRNFLATLPPIPVS